MHAGGPAEREPGEGHKELDLSDADQGGRGYRPNQTGS